MNIDFYALSLSMFCYRYIVGKTLILRIVNSILQPYFYKMTNFKTNVRIKKDPIQVGSSLFL